MSPLLLSAPEFGISWFTFVVQVMNFSLIIAYLLTLVYAVLRVAKRGKGVEVPIWIIVIAVIPLLGVVGALSHYSKSSPK